MTIPQTEIDRIEKEAFKHATDRPAELESHIRQESYLAGAKAEAFRGRELAAGFSEWIIDEAYRQVLGERRWYTVKNPNATPITTAELLDMYIEKLNKKG